MENTVSPERMAEIIAMAERNTPPPVTVTVDRKRYTIEGGWLQIIRARRDLAASFSRAYNAPGNVRVLTALRNDVAEWLNVDKATASYVLRKIK